MTWSPGDLGRPGWFDWGRWRYRLFKYGFPPGAAALLVGAGYAIYLVWEWAIK